MSQQQLCHAHEMKLIQKPVETHKPHPRAQFTEEEDTLLIELVNKYGENNWQQIADLMPGRNIRQCRERWRNYLSPSFDKGPWSKQEDMLLLQKYNELGPKWKTIALFLPTRTDISVKNRMHKIARNLKKEGLLVSQAFSFPHILSQVSTRASKKIRKVNKPKTVIKSSDPQVSNERVKLEPQEQPQIDDDYKGPYADGFDTFSNFIEDQDVFAINFENGFGMEFQDFTL